ncbi:MAG: pyruvate kinase, partial [Demequinaceae bacterium]|nr:pyruvate kinase [Demequinaceae bacterium]
MRNAKIVCTIGPATASLEQMKLLVEAGMDVARINRSHGSEEEHEAVYNNVRQAAKEAGRNVAVLVDLQGPKIRLARFIDGPHDLAVGDVFTITTRDVEGTKDICGTTFKGLAGDCKPGDFLLIDDGKVRVEVLEVKDGTDVVTKVIVPGPVSNNKGINLPGVAVSVPAMSEKDESDLRWGLKMGADFIALSFVRSAADYADVARIMAEEGRIVPVIAKVEKPQAVDNLEEIVDAFDGVMVARGDLGVELPLEDVPLVQKRAIELCRSQAKPVIVATQVLESMTHSPVPTRAETSDCANAILDGADAVMLSGETSVGDFPIITVETMARIIQNTEEKGFRRIAPYKAIPKTRGGAITHA